MHARELIELAGLVVAHGPLLVESQEPVANENIERYWVTSKTRLDRWAHSLKEFAEGGNGDVPFSLHLRGVLEEILVSEVLTRVWTAVLCAYDHSRGAEDAGPVARSVMLGHIEARHRALSLVVQAESGREKGPGPICRNGPSGASHKLDQSPFPPSFPPEVRSGKRRKSPFPLGAGMKLNSLRRRAERWTDILVGHLAARAEKGTGPICRNGPSGASHKLDLSPFPLPPLSVLEFAADPRRAEEFAAELRDQGAADRLKFAWPLLLASLRAAFQRGLDAPSPNAELNAKIAASIIACFPAELFAGTGLFHSVWMMHLMNVADDAQGMIDQLLAPQRAPARKGFRDGGFRDLGI